jgi:predicted component of type VI protein secretion system
MPVRLLALDEGADIPVDREMLVVGRHPQCDARLDSIRVSRRHCCMMQKNGELMIRDLGSTNGIRINGQRVESGRLRPGDELSIAHIRFRLDDGQGQEATLAGSIAGPLPAERAEASAEPARIGLAGGPAIAHLPPVGGKADNPLAAAVRELLPAGVAERCRIQVIVQVPPAGGDQEASPVPCSPDSSP